MKQSTSFPSKILPLQATLMHFRETCYRKLFRCMNSCNLLLAQSYTIWNNVSTWNPLMLFAICKQCLFVHLCNNCQILHHCKISSAIRKCNRVMNCQLDGKNLIGFIDSCCITILCRFKPWIQSREFWFFASRDEISCEIFKVIMLQEQQTLEAWNVK